MAEVMLTIGGHRYPVHCRDGEEPHLERLAAIIDEKAIQARQNAPGLTEVRQLLFAAILLADEVHDGRAHIQAQEDDGAEAEIAARIDAITHRIQALASALAPATQTT